MCRIFRRNPAGPFAPRCPATPPHRPIPPPLEGEVDAGLGSDADRAERFGEKQGKGEAGGRETSPSRSRKPKPTRELESGKPKLQTANPRVPGLGPGRSTQPPPPRPFLKPLAPRPHPSPPAAPCPTGPKPLPWTTAARGICLLQVGLEPQATSRRSRSGTPIPALSSALPCSAGDGPPSCMLTLLRHFRKCLRPGGCPASSPLAKGRW